MKTLFVFLALGFSANAFAGYFYCPKVSCQNLGCVPTQLRSVTVNSDIGYFSTEYDDGGGFELTDDQIYVQGTPVTFDRKKECQELKYFGKRGITYTFKCLQKTDTLDVIFAYDPAKHNGTYRGTFNHQALQFDFAKCVPSP